MAQKNTGDTMVEGLKKILSMIAQLTILPDADLNFLTQLQQTVGDQLRGGGQAPGAGADPNNPQGAAGAPPGPDMGSLGMPPPGVGSPPPGMNTGGASMGINPMGAMPGGGDELQRMLAQQGSGQ